MLDSAQIKTMVPHRDAMLLVPHVDEMEAYTYAIMRHTYPEDHAVFRGHFPGNPIFPGVLIIETLAQLAAILAVHSVATTDALQPYLASIEKAKFLKPIVPNTEVTFRVDLVRQRETMWKFKGYAMIQGELVHEGEFLAMMGTR